jgi:NADH:ubiquinone oxidoreductase subunit E
VAFDAANLDKARDIIARYPHKKSATLPLLHLAQDQDGWVTPDAMVEIVAACDLAPVLQVNYEFHGPLTNDAADELIDDYKRGTLVARTISGTPVAAPGAGRAAGGS